MAAHHKLKHPVCQQDDCKVRRLDRRRGRRSALGGRRKFWLARAQASGEGAILPGAECPRPHPACVPSLDVGCSQSLFPRVSASGSPGPPGQLSRRGLKLHRRLRLALLPSRRQVALQGGRDHVNPPSSSSLTTANCTRTPCRCPGTTAPSAPWNCLPTPPFGSSTANHPYPSARCWSAIPMVTGKTRSRYAFPAYRSPHLRLLNVQSPAKPVTR